MEQEIDAKDLELIEYRFKYFTSQLHRDVMLKITMYRLNKYLSRRYDQIENFEEIVEGVDYDIDKEIMETAMSGYDGTDNDRIFFESFQVPNGDNMLFKLRRRCDDMEQYPKCSVEYEKQS